MGFSEEVSKICRGKFNDGIVDRWPGFLVVLGSILVEFSVFGMFNSFPGYQSYISQDPTAGKPTLVHISISDAIVSCCNPFLGILAGFSIAYIGGQGCCLIALCCSLGYQWLVSSFLKNTLTLYLFFSIPGAFSIAFMLPVVLALTSSWFNRYRSFALGLVNIGGGLGMTVVPAFAGYIMHHSNNNWRYSMRICSAFLVFGFIGAFLVRARPGDNSAIIDTEKKETDPMYDNENVHPDTGALEPVNCTHLPLSELLAAVIPTRTYISLFFTYGLYCMCFFSTLYLIVNYALQMGKPNTIYSKATPMNIGVAASLFSWYGAGHTTGPILFGSIGVKVDARILSCLLFLTSGLLTIVWSLARSYYFFAILLLVLGGINSAAGVLFTTVIGERYDGPNIGVCVPLVFFAAICGLAGVPVATKLFVMTGNYSCSCIFIGCCMLCGSVVQFFFVPKMSYYKFYQYRVECMNEKQKKIDITTMSDNENRSKSDNSAPYAQKN